MKNTCLLISLVIVMLAGCGNPSGHGEGERAPAGMREFPKVVVPAMMSSTEQRIDYITTHYWDAFFAGEGTTGPDSVLGVTNDDLELAISSFIIMLDNLPMDDAQSKVERLFRSIEDYERRDTSSLVYLLMTEKISRYLYDPNSPVRSEDYFLPFVSGMAESPFTREDARPGYVFERNMCSMNRYGQKAPDFRFVDAAGKTHTLYGVKAEHTVLFFSNPGCHACRDIVEMLDGSPSVKMQLNSGRLAVVNIYIDEDLEKWREYLPSYPAEWFSGYDPLHVLRENSIYYVRAIPSLYLLDAEKRVIYKDAPVEKVLQFIERNR